MKRTVLIMVALSCFFSMFAKGKKNVVLVNRVDPACWYVGLNDPSLQLMLYGDNIREAEVTTDYAGVEIESVVRLDSPNYLLVYLNTKGAQAGTMQLNIVNGKQKQVLNYELKNREMAGDKRMGFTNADVLYMLMPDRFAAGENTTPANLKTEYRVDRTEPSLRHGGNLAGIREHLDYFNELGVTALWFTPVLENDSPDNGKVSTYHGYATTDYYRVDPRFGTNQDYREFLDAAHEKGLKVVMDMIFNHCGFEHPWVTDMPSKDWFNAPEWLDAPKTAPATTAEGQSTTYKGGLNDLYLQTNYKLTTTVDPYASKVDTRETVDGWFVPSMPDLNQRNKHVMTYLIQNSIWWIETVGIDGIRMDTYPYADAKGMSRWMKRLNDEYPHYNVVGESWVVDPAFTAALQKDSHLKAPLVKCCGHCEKEGKHCDEKPFNTYLNTVMDFAFFDRINRAKYEETGDWNGGFNNIYTSLCYDYLYADPTNVMAFLDNHDTDRFLGDGKDVVALKQAMALLLTINRIPQIYYGTEILMNGTKAITDGYVRCDFPGGFAGDKENKFTREGRTVEENEFFDWISRLLHWRQGNELITKGKMTQFIPYKGIYVIARQYNGKTSLTILNGLKKEAVMGIKRYAEVIGNTTQGTDILTGKQINLTQDITLAPREVMVVEY